MEVFEAIRKRRSVRSYMASGIDRAQLERIIEAATWAPSAGNLQPWIFIVVDDKYLMRQLAKAALNQMWIVEASCIIAVCADVERSGRVYGERGR
ncbi:MAG: nitroreductase family protein, partial [Desulfurococcaceae archaeon]